MRARLLLVYVVRAITSGGKPGFEAAIAGDVATRCHSEGLLQVIEANLAGQAVGNRLYCVVLAGELLKSKLASYEDKGKEADVPLTAPPMQP